ncbi:MAG TPA: acetyl-CoA hydrolase/transferase C-terminal domain-containing protein [Thermoanaerobaculia bacterium]|nr:acetyl-CoA hydrolase/transferase C-terminal domain-containing protein [Thermoanaerobaculia bacterium]
MERVEVGAIDLRALVRPGDTVTFGQGTAEPQTLTEALVAQRAGIGRFRVFLGSAFTDTFLPDHHDLIDFLGVGAIGTNRRLTRARCLEVIPCHVSHIPGLIRDGTISVDVLMVQVSPPNERGEYSPALANDYMRLAAEKARIVIAEVNARVPQTSCTAPFTADDFDVVVETDRPLIQLPAAKVGELERQVAAHVDKYIPDRATLQVGIGAIPEAIMALLTQRRDLGIHSGMIGDSVASLMEAGVITNAHKGIDAGVSVTGVLFGTDRLYRYAHRNAAIRVCPIDYTHGPDTLGKLRRLVSINSALEVDLTGQVNGEGLGADYIGAVGGQVDFVRAAARCEDGVSIIALPSTAKGGEVTRIVPRLSGPVTTPRSDVDVIATEHGAVRLHGLPLGERVKAMVSIAAPQHRDALLADWKEAR